MTVEKSGDALTTKELWNAKTGAQYNTPIVKDGRVYGTFEPGPTVLPQRRERQNRVDEQGEGSGGYGSIVDAGSVLFALTPAAELIVFEPNEKEFKKIASYPVGKDTYAYPVIAGKRIFIKDSDSVTLWSIE